MQLWTEYEGRKIAGTYTLGKLLRSEGRNGFFATADTTGNAAVIRLTEAHYDEDELLKRWRQVADMHEANLIGIERFGQTDFFEVGLPEALDSNKIGLMHVRDLPPALEKLIFIVVGLSEADNRGVAGSVGGGEEPVAAFGAQQLTEGIGLGDLPSFVFGPELHQVRSMSWESLAAAAGTARGSSSAKGGSFALSQFGRWRDEFGTFCTERRGKARTTVGTSGTGNPATESAIDRT